MKRINKKAAFTAAIFTILSMAVATGLAYLSQLNNAIVNWIVLSLLTGIIAFNFYQIFKLVYNDRVKSTN